MRRITIKTRLYATAIGIFIILFAIGLIANYYIHNALSNFDSMALIKDINYGELQLRKLEKDFINLETKKASFYKNQHSSYQDKFAYLIEDVQHTIGALKKEHIIKSNKLHIELSNTEDKFSSYHKKFESLVEIILSKGFKDYGLIGQMRNKIHAVEDLTNQYPGHPEFKISMLMLRRNEKDYLLRKDLKYKDKFKANLEKFKTQINQANISRKEQFTQLLNDYYSLFQKVIELDIKIGLTEKKGLIHALNTTSGNIEKSISSIQKTISQEARKEVNQAIKTLFIVSILLTVLIISILLGVTRRILNSIKRLRNFILRLGNGDLPKNLVVKKDDEIGDMIHSINSLLENLRNTRQFALQVGKGNLKEDINVFGNKGDLGGSLVEMRAQLLTLAEERARNEEEARRRNWINEGVARFSDIMRSHETDMKQMAYRVLSELISYIDANQGAFFILRNEDKKTSYLEKIAAVAYGRDKIAGEKEEIGKSIVGRAVFEKQSILMTKIPEDYIKITSGLGFATPRNLFIAPIIKDDDALGAIELATFNEIPEYIQDFIARVCNNLGTTISAFKTNERTQKLLHQAQEQADEIASQEEELRQNMEEMQATQEEANRREESLRQELAAYYKSCPTIETDLQGNITKTNELAQTMLQTTEAYLKDQMLTSFVPEENDKNKVNNMLKSTLNSLQSETYAVLHLHGKNHPVYMTCAAVKSDDALQKVVVLLHKACSQELSDYKNPEDHAFNPTNMQSYN
ncbi:MAG TPA: HAMP domain-containing protein [Salinivirga sp.]|uniref:HAMP domain-containing protein n=1 Tax=Salinivirga sp. TaxID=1970192 RepID=UPI002B4A4BC6|nr:HAMP domain-containing protein [Salinivirga sp.]HKK57960.1 HAMP domain-containing protein [Salinivirga sp.]